MSNFAIGGSPVYNRVAFSSTQPTENKDKTEGLTDDSLQSKSARESFLEYAHMNPIERIRAAYLKENNLTEESLAALPQEERDKVEEAIKQMIERKLGNTETGKAARLDIQV